MHPEEIKAAIRMNGHTAASIADDLGVSRTTVGQIIHGQGQSARIKKHISDLIGIPVGTLWPPTPKLRRPKGAAHRRAATAARAAR